MPSVKEEIYAAHVGVFEKDIHDRLFIAIQHPGIEALGRMIESLRLEKSKHGDLSLTTIQFIGCGDFVQCPPRARGGRLGFGVGILHEQPF